MDKIDCLVIGAGVVGLAIARKIASLGYDTIVVEKELAIGTETSARNSEVIHAGIYYPSHSLKAKLCVKGNELLYNYCEKYHINHKRCGKIIVATNENQFTDLKKLQQQAHNNQVPPLKWLDKLQIKKLEPNLNAAGALLSRTTGIIDSHAYMLALQGDIEAHNGIIAFNSNVSSAEITQEGILITISSDTPYQLLAKNVINCAGLYASQVARNIKGLDKKYIPRTYYAKGNYFSIAKRPPFSHLIYPIPEPGGLGVHLTLDLAGQGRFGPDVEWVNEIDYKVNTERSNRFYEEIRKYWPELQNGSLQADYSGIRPKIVAEGEASTDFRIDTQQFHNIKGLINLFGIESPGLTSSLAIANYVATFLDKNK